jgi:hypothetical protein
MTHLACGMQQQNIGTSRLACEHRTCRVLNPATIPTRSVIWPDTPLLTVSVAPCSYNYQAAGEALGFDGINKPELVAQDPVLAFRTAFWFWMTAQSPKPSAHDVMAGRWTPSAQDTAAGRAPGFGKYLVSETVVLWQAMGVVSYKIADRMCDTFCAAAPALTVQSASQTTTAG